MTLKHRRLTAVLAALVLWFAAAPTAHAVTIGVWMDGLADGNAIDDFIDSVYGAGSALVLTTADLESAATVATLDAIVLTRSDSLFGIGLSAAAAANVSAFGSGGAHNVALMGDWFDMLTGSFSGDPADVNVEAVVQNALDFALLNHGVVGEFNGAAMMFASNSDGFIPLGLFAGAAGPLGFFSDAVDTVSHTAAGAGHPVLAGVPDPFSPLEISTFRTAVSGADPSLVRAIWADDVPAVIAANPIPEPSAVVVFAVGALIVGSFVARRSGRA